MLKSISAALLGLVLAIGMLLADTRPLQAQQPAPPAEALQAAKDLLASLGSDKQLESMIPLMLQNIRQLIVRQSPQAEKQIDEALASLMTKFTARRGELIDEVAVAYARMVPVEDLKAMTAFFQSPAGQRFVALQPELTRQTMAVGQRWGEKLGREVDMEVQQELKKRGVKP